MRLIAKDNDPEHFYQRRLVFLLCAQTAILILVSLNRLTDFSAMHVADNQFLRWREFNHLMVFPPLTVLVAIAIRQTLYRFGRRQNGWVDLLFIISVYFLGAGYGVHELANYLSTLVKGKSDFDPRIREIIRFNDDDFSHWVFFAAFIALNAVMLFWQRLNPFATSMSVFVKLTCLANAAVLSLAIYVNLTRGDLGFDLVVLLFLAVLALFFWWKDKRQPLNIYYLFGLWPGLVATAVAKLIQAKIS